MPKTYQLPHSVYMIVKCICTDYDRRCVALKKGQISDSVREEMERLNGVVDTSLTLVEEGIRREMLYDIILGRGYDSSPASAIISKNAFYLRKRQIVQNIAETLSLI